MGSVRLLSKSLGFSFPKLSIRCLAFGLLMRTFHPPPPQPHPLCLDFQMSDAFQLLELEIL